MISVSITVRMTNPGVGHRYHRLIREYFEEKDEE